MKRYKDDNSFEIHNQLNIAPSADKMAKKLIKTAKMGTAEADEEAGAGVVAVEVPPPPDDPSVDVPFP